MFKKNSLAIKKKIGNVYLKTTMTDLTGNQISIEDLIHLRLPEFPVLFMQEELLEIFSKEIFTQQLVWKTVQEKELKECDKIEKEIKKMPRMPRCSDVLKRLWIGFGIRDLRSSKHTISYDTCLRKLEEIVKSKWDEWEEKQAKTSIE